MLRMTVTPIMLLAAWLTPAPPAGAADVAANVSSREVFVDVPFVLQVTIENAADHETPQLPELIGVQVLGDPSESSSSFMQIINGRVTQRETVTLSYRLRATRAGPFVIGPITVVADGQTFRTAPIQMTATTSQTGDVLFLEVVADRDRYYLGETIDLDLEIWLKPYRDRRTGLALDNENMWQLLDARASSLGPFADYERPVRVRTELRADAEGVDREYFVYRLRSRITPQQAGPLTFDDVRVVVRYPLGLQRRRSFFDRGWEVTSSRPAVAAVQRAPISIEAPPAEGRPASFTGAVGRFDLDVSARPTEVAVGDPVTLTMVITDRTPAGAQLEALQPPALTEVPALVERFRIPDDPLAGVVEGRRKTFTQTVRAKNDTVSAIPAIPLTYFDPEQKRYVTVASDPIALTVVPAANISVTDVVGAEPGRAAGPTELTEVAGGILANYGGPELLVSQPVLAATWAHGAAAAMPPVLFGVVAVARRRTRRLRDDRGYARQRGARRRALRRLRAAGSEQGARRAEATARALADYVADRCNLPAGALTSAEVVDRVRRARVPDGLVADLEAVLASCEQLRYAGASGDPDGLTERAVRCVNRLERERLA